MAAGQRIGIQQRGQRGFMRGVGRRRRRVFLGQPHGEGMQPFFLNVVKPLREKQPSAAAYFVSPDLQRHLHITINTTDGNLLLGQSSPSLAPQHFHAHHFQVTTDLI